MAVELCPDASNAFGSNTPPFFAAWASRWKVRDICFVAVTTKGFDTSASCFAKAWAFCACTNHSFSLSNSRLLVSFGAASVTADFAAGAVNMAGVDGICSAGFTVIDTAGDNVTDDVNIAGDCFSGADSDLSCWLVPLRTLFSAGAASVTADFAAGAINTAGVDGICSAGFTVTDTAGGNVTDDVNMAGVDGDRFSGDSYLSCWLVSLRTLFSVGPSRTDPLEVS